MTQPKPSLPSGVAVDFGGTKIAAARVVVGKVVERRQIATDGGASVEEQVAAICGLLDQLDLQAEDRVGVALAGRVNREGEWFAVNTDTLSQITAVPLRAILSDRLQRAVMVQNDAIAAAVGEHMAGAGQGVPSMGFVTVSTGVGGGLILNGKPLISETGLAGHLGFTTTRTPGGTCGCGRRQTVESVASGRAIAAQAAALGYSGMDAKMVYEAHLAGEIWATNLVKSSALVVGELCANLKSLLDLERIVLGGSIGMAQGYIELVEQALKDEPELFQIPVMRAELGTDSALVGVLAD